jgi:hypothetical protein
MARNFNLLTFLTTLFCLSIITVNAQNTTCTTDLVLACVNTFSDGTKNCATIDCMCPFVNTYLACLNPCLSTTTLDASTQADIDKLKTQCAGKNAGTKMAVHGFTGIALMGVAVFSAFML